MTTLVSPVLRSALPMTSWPGMKRLVTHTGTFAARSGKGGPNVSVLIEPVPVGPQRPQSGFVVSSHPTRHNFSIEPPTTGKLCDVPVHPLSRSVPLLATVTSASLGPPAGFGGHVAEETGTLVQGMAVGGVTAPQKVGGVPKIHFRRSVSGSDFGFPSELATARIFIFPGLF